MRAKLPRGVSNRATLNRPVLTNCWLPKWPGPFEPLPSAFSVLATPACLDSWTTAQLAGVLAQRHPTSELAFWGWSTIAAVAVPLGKLLNRRPESLRLGAELRRWYPECLQGLLPAFQDTTDTARLRFCRACLAHGFHSPLFQLPWWDGCPVHGEFLAEGCPACGELLPAGLEMADPARWLYCRACGYALSDPGRLTQRSPTIPDQAKARWWSCLSDYFRWLRATDRAQWPLPWEVEGEGSFDEVARVAGRSLARVVPPPASLKSHLIDHLQRPSARVWTREFVEPLRRPSVRALGFAKPKDMQDAGRHFYGALPVPPEAFEALRRSHRHVRRGLRVHMLGRDAPGATGGDEYLWAGPRPLAVLGFRLLTGLTGIERVQGVNYLDFRAVELVREPPAQLAQELLAAWTGVDLRPLRCWPQELAYVLMDQNWAMSGSRPAPPLRVEPVPHGALRWLYSRMITETWHDVALECFARAHPTHTIAWTCGQAPRECGNRLGPVAVPVTLPISDPWAAPEQREHPLLVHARSDRQRPRGWAAGVLRLGIEENAPFVALLGRSASAPFAKYASTWQARWVWPAEPSHAPEERASA